MYFKGKLLSNNDTCGLEYRIARFFVGYVLPFECSMPVNYRVLIRTSEMVLGPSEVLTKRPLLINRRLLPYSNGVLRSPDSKRTTTSVLLGVT